MMSMPARIPPIMSPDRERISVVGELTNGLETSISLAILTIFAKTISTSRLKSLIHRTKYIFEQK